MIPLYDELLRYSKEKYISFHTPGHCSGRSLGTAWQKNEIIANLDLTEVSALAWEKSRKCAERLTADFYKADHSFFLTQGASQGIIAAIISCFKPGDKVLIARNCHISVYNAIVIAELIPVFIEVDLLPEWGLPVGINLHSLNEKLGQHPECKGLIVTNPTYQGIASKLVQYRDAIGDRLLIVDEAHGGHLEWCGLSGFDAYQYADIWVQGTHKFLGSLTQTGLLHLKTLKLKVEQIERGLSLISTTSPSFILMSSLDCNRNFLMQKGRRLFAEKIELVNQAKKDIANLNGVKVLTLDVNLETDENLLMIDPWRIVISLLPIGLNGYQTEKILVKDFQIQPEYADFNQVTFLVSPWQDESALVRLVASFSSLVDRFHRKPIQPIINQVSIPPLILNPRTAMLGESELIKMLDAVGRVAATVVAPYPPGIPLISPGELIESETVVLMNQLIDSGAKIKGLSENNKIMVTCE